MRKTETQSFPIKLLIFIAIIFLATFFIIGYIWKSLGTADYFKIKDIVTTETDKVDLSYLKGKNIFSVDLRNESRYISEFYPDYKKIKLVRVLPNLIFVNFIKRKPVAFVKLYRYFALDEDGVLFYESGRPEELELPLILGLETKIFGPKPGRKYNIKELMLALGIIKEARENRVLKDYRIKTVDVTNLANTSFFIPLPARTLDYSKIQLAAWPQVLEVKIGQEEIKDKLAMLADLISQVKGDLANIKYIDLRFKEAVIKLKDVK